MTAIVGFLLIVGLLFASAGNIDFVYSNELSVNDLMASCAGSEFAFVLGILLIINVFFSGLSSMTVTSRIAFAMARDGAFPFSSTIHYIYPRTKSPFGAILLTLAADIVLILTNLGASEAFIAITSIAVIGYQISYSIPVLMRVTVAKKTFHQCEFNLGPYSIVLGWITAFWLISTSILFFLPTVYPVTVENMNYTIVMAGGVSLISIVHWFVSARHWFKGPKRVDRFSHHL